MATKQLAEFSTDDVEKVCSSLSNPPLLSSPFSHQHNKPDNVYDLSRFMNLHPGGTAVLLDESVAGQEAAELFYGLHRHEVLERPQYSLLHIGIIRGESVIESRTSCAISKVPYAEPCG